MNEDFIRGFQEQLPALKSQAQFNAFMASFEAFRGVMNAIFACDVSKEKQLRDIFEESLEAARKVTELTQKLEEAPEAATSTSAQEFKKAPLEFSEYDKQRTLLSELSALPTIGALKDWYTENRKRIDEVLSPSLRNPLLDAIRAKQSSLLTQSQV